MAKAPGPVEQPPAPISLVRLRSGRVSWFVRQSPVPHWLEQFLQDPDGCIEVAGPFIAHTPLITLARWRPADPEAPTLLLRRLNYGRARHALRDVFRRTRAERAFRHGLALERAGVSTPRSWAAGVRRRGRWPLRGYLVTDWVEDAITLEDLLGRGQTLARPQWRQMAELLARLHNAGYSHRDLKSSNILFGRDGNPVLIDLDGVRPFNPARRVRAVADLARFVWEFARFPRMLRFSGRRSLKWYCAARGWSCSREDRRQLEQQVLEPTARRLRAGVNYWKP